MQTIELDITTMAHGGSGIGRVDGRVVFCPGVIPGEVVRAEITENSKKSLWRAQAVEVLKPSPHRVEHIWPEASIERPWQKRAGGADYGHIALAHQRELKTAILTDALTRFGGLEGNIVSDITVRGVPGDDERNGLGWRTRVTVHGGDNRRLGPYAEKSHTVIPVKALPLASPAIRESGLLGASFEGATSVRALDTTGSGLRFIVDDQTPQTISEHVGDHTFELLDQSFWQVHQAAPLTLGGAVQRAVVTELFDPEAPQMDLYSGVGLLGHALSQLSDTPLDISAVESDESAVSCALKNLASVARVTPYAQRVDAWLRGQVRSQAGSSHRPWARSTVILDPPRAGAKSDVIDSLVALEVRQIVYVACDPVALGRDAGLLLNAGYEMVSLEAWDLFPHTHHMEAIATFVKNSHPNT
jgi:tRNA/tmRNA/rRNA uracil-C5-methylase (TrmA/RlmC/RlmD family)